VKFPLLVFTARRYGSAVYAVIVYLSIRPSVCLNLGSHKQRHTIAQGLQLSDAKISMKFQPDHLEGRVGFLPAETCFCHTCGL